MAHDPLALISSTDEPEMVELFSIDGKPYFIPNKVRVNVGLKYLHQVRTTGDAAANSWLLEALLGEEGYQALLDYDDLTAEDLERVQAVAVEIVLGRSEEGKAETRKKGRK